jgi:hypothetical protein
MNADEMEGEQKTRERRRREKGVDKEGEVEKAGKSQGINV